MRLKNSIKKIIGRTNYQRLKLFRKSVLKIARSFHEFLENTFFEFKKIRFYAVRKFVIKEYLRTHKIRKLQIGGGDSYLSGWLNTDFFPKSNKIAFLDATEPFPFENSIFDYIAFEHMIEHIRYQEALSLLKECFRVLRPNGKLRISTPDLKKYLDLFTPDKIQIQKKYLEWISLNWLKRQKIDIVDEVLVLNLMMHGWQHKFLYNFAALKRVLAEAGFVNIVQSSCGVSEDEHFQGIEMHGDSIGTIKAIKGQSNNLLNNQMNDFGTLVVEALKP